MSTLTDLQKNKCNILPREIITYVTPLIYCSTQVHNFTVSAQDILPSVDFRYLPQVLQEICNYTSTKCFEARL